MAKRRVYGRCVECGNRTTGICFRCGVPLHQECSYKGSTGDVMEDLFICQECCEQDNGELERHSASCPVGCDECDCIEELVDLEDDK